ncbi:rhamnogalacturonan acetylesterase [Vulcaniibacterium tengchongense]|nr:rhamnogalacturonan acetylesterase [Vulcaniibacterium tengchongense]
MRRAAPWLLALGLAAAHAAPASRPPPVPVRADKIVLVGDSTVQAHSGWGGAFCARHAAPFLACLNLGRGGRSSYSYRAEGSWELARRELRGGGYGRVWVLIQFGHNDQPGKPERSTDLAEEFPANLRRYVDEARADGARPVLVTPLTRRQFRDGRLVDDLAPWAEAIRRVARERQVPLVDLHARSVAAVQALGPVASMRFAQRPATPELVAAALQGTTAEAPPAPAPPPAAADATAPLRLAFDYTHLGGAGAEFFAALVADELARAVPELRPRLLP